MNSRQLTKMTSTHGEGWGDKTLSKMNSLAYKAFKVTAIIV